MIPNTSYWVTRKCVLSNFKSIHRYLHLSMLMVKLFKKWLHCFIYFHIFTYSNFENIWGEVYFFNLCSVWLFFYSCLFVFTIIFSVSGIASLTFPLPGKTTCSCDLYFFCIDLKVHVPLMLCPVVCVACWVQLNTFSATIYMSILSCLQMTLVPHPTNWMEYYEWPFNENMFSFTSKPFSTPPYGCNPPPMTSAGTTCQTNGGLLFHTPCRFTPVMLFALSVISKWNNWYWNNSL